MLISTMWLHMFVYSFGWLWWPIHQKWTVTYQSQHFTINCQIAECDHECETWNAEPEIGTNWSIQLWHTHRVDVYGSGFGLPNVSGSCFWTGLVPNQPVSVVQTRTAGGSPRLIANTKWAHCDPKEASGSKRRDIYCLSNKEKVKYIENSVERNTAVSR